MVDAPGPETPALLALADDDLAVGHVLTSVAGFGPDLEINVALSSMGQDELGHARAYYGLVYGPDRDAINEAIYGRDARDYRAAPLSWVYGEAWETLAVKSFLYETADAARRATLAAGGDDGLRRVVERMEGEEQYHLDFWAAWMAQTAERGDDARRRLQVALDCLWWAAVDLFEVPSAEILVAGGFAAARGRWAAAAALELDRAGLATPAVRPTGLGDADRDRVLDELHYVYCDAPGRW